MPVNGIGHDGISVKERWCEHPPSEGKDIWEVYGESQGGTVRVEIGNQFVFIFRDGFDLR